MGESGLSETGGLFIDAEGMEEREAGGVSSMNSSARGIDAKNYVTDKYLKRLEEEGFVKKLWEK